MPIDQAVEKSPQRRKVELLGRYGQVQALEILADISGSDLGQLEAAVFDPGEELSDGVHVVLAFIKQAGADPSDRGCGARHAGLVKLRYCRPLAGQAKSRAARGWSGNS